MVFASGFRALGDVCQVDGCAREVVAKGLCRHHYDLWRRHGSPADRVRSRQCAECGELFPLERSSAKYCSDRCRQRAARRKRLSPAASKPKAMPIIECAVSPEPEKRSSIVYDAYTVDDVWERSHGLCYVCGLPASRHIDDADAGTPAWIVSPDDGGRASLENRAIMHYRCLKR